MSRIVSTTRRRNPLTNEWVLNSAGRNDRPWTGQIEKTPIRAQDVSFDKHCPLCPGVVRATGTQNPAYKGVYTFDNDFPAIRSDCDGIRQSASKKSELFDFRSEVGSCRVICFSPDHCLTLARLADDSVKLVVDAWCEETAFIASDSRLKSAQIFENRGAMMGCSNPHPHGQVWAQEAVPTELRKEVNHMVDYYGRHGSSLLVDYVNEELQKGERIIFRNRSFVALVPYWASWPFEAMILPTREFASLLEITETERSDFANAIQRLAARYDNLFEMDFPYTAGIHQAPLDGKNYRGFCTHMHFYPPLLRSSTIRKFMVGYEMLAEPQRDISPEEAASVLSRRADTHYLSNAAADIESATVGIP